MTILEFLNTGDKKDISTYLCETFQTYLSYSVDIAERKGLLADYASSLDFHPCDECPAGKYCGNGDGFYRWLHEEEAI